MKSPQEQGLGLTDTKKNINKNKTTCEPRDQNTCTFPSLWSQKKSNITNWQTAKSQWFSWSHNLYHPLNSLPTSLHSQEAPNILMMRNCLIIVWGDWYSRTFGATCRDIFQRHSGTDSFFTTVSIVSPEFGSWTKRSRYV